MFVPKPGVIVGNRYSLTQVIGRGGMGEVWKAHDRELDSACAVKFIVQHLASDRGIRERFSREAKAVARLRSPHVVHILGVGEVENIPYLAMELLEGETLLARLHRHGKLPPAMTLKVIEQVAEALEGAHQAGIVHRDLKPDNVWFWSGNKVFVKVLDFGVAKTGLTTESLQTATGALVGTPQYMSPEQALGNRDVDHRSDLWSLAVITIECLSGKRPFESAGLGDLLLKIVGAKPPTLESFAPELPNSLQEWWIRALARDPRDRFQSATELAEALRPHLMQFDLDGPYSANPVPSSPVPLMEDAVVSVRGGVSGRRPGTDPGGRVPSARFAAPLSVAEQATSVRPGSLGFNAGGGTGAASRSAASVPAGSIPAAAAALAPPRSPGSVGPTSSTRGPGPSRTDNRQRTLLLAAALLAVAVVVTVGRLLLSEDAEQTGSPAPALPPVAAAPGPAPSTLQPPAGGGTGPTISLLPSGEARPAPAADSPWDQALRSGKSAGPESAVSTLQPRREPAPVVAPVKPSVGIAPVPPQAAVPAPSVAPKPVAVAPPKPGPAKPSRPDDMTQNAPLESPAAAAGAGTNDGPSETEAAKKKRLRDLVGLPKTN